MTIEELQDENLKLKEKQSELEATLNEKINLNQKLNEDNKRLMDYNNKLFLKVTNQFNSDESGTQETEEEKEEQEMKEIFNLVKENL